MIRQPLLHRQLKVHALTLQLLPHPAKINTEISHYFCFCYCDRDIGERDAHIGRFVMHPVQLGMLQLLVT
jgi:hypothetical protein